ncbi:MAG: SufD family Fe-S cluster assembly protein [Bacilli bacterium]|nr:SufD family Fe-S cluster assembly protein [Bacilli bacterium]
MSEVVIKLTSTQESCEICLKENEHKTLIVFNDGTIEATYNLNAKLEKGASLDIYNVATTYKNATLNETIDLCDEEATCNILNVLLVGDKAHFASNIFINHLKKHTTSDFQNYAIAVDNANMILNNNAKIVQGASKSIVRQKAKGLTLSSTAKIKAMPNLYIDEYDVIANHAASIGSISKEDLFYLMSRGLEERDAAKLIVLGFVQPLLDKIADESLRKEIQENFVSKL